MKLNVHEKMLLREVFKLAKDEVDKQLGYAISMYDAKGEVKTLALHKKIEALETQIFSKDK